jgi:predicted PurR-regulated permease PerM
VANASATVPWQRAVVVLAGTAVFVVLVASMYWAQVVFIPAAMGIFLAFLLNPLVRGLQRWGLGRLPAVILAVLTGTLVMGGLGWLAVGQFTTLVDDLPTYTPNIKKKIEAVQHFGAGSPIEHMIKEITEQLKPETADLGLGEPPAVVVQPDSPAWLGSLPTYLRPALETLAGMALAVVLAFFMLVKREDLRDRVIHLVGHGRVTLTTKAVDEACQRISRYLLMQLAVNGVYGLALAGGLFWIGVPQALLWGLLGGVLRYIPYLGGLITAVLLATLSLAIFPGWVPPLLVLGFILALELVTGNFLEPWLYGQSLGVSEVALLISAALWAFLWGPIGLVLSGPLAVCLVVLGKYVPALEFLAVLLGDEVVLAPHVSFYQRLLARDRDEAAQLFLDQAKTCSRERVYDELLVPVLISLKRDRERDELTEADELFILEAIRDMTDLRLPKEVREGASESPAEGATRPKICAIGCPVQDGADMLALEMFRQLLDPARWDLEIASPEMLSAEMVELAGEKAPAIVCVGALPPGGLAQTRYLCRRLRARLPDAKIVVGRFGLHANVQQNQDQLREAGADQMETTLVEMRDHLNTWLPVFEHVVPKPAEVQRLQALPLLH